MTARHLFRLIDSGVRDGRVQIAYDAALTELHEKGKVGDTVRFMRFPPTVLVGRHQVLRNEVNVDRCLQEGIGLVRRISGGGAIYLDEGQVGWELVVNRKTLGLGSLGDHAEAICSAVALGLSDRFGIPARFRPRNDIEVDGRKISGSGGYFSADTLVYQGTVLVDMDAARMARLLNIPAQKLERHGAANSAARIVTLKELLGRSPTIDEVHGAILHGLSQNLAIDVEAQDPGIDEKELTGRLHDDEIGLDSFVFGSAFADGEVIQESRRDTAGGSILVQARLEGPQTQRRIREILITGDFFVAPPRAIYDLEAALRGVLARDAKQAISTHLENGRPEILSIQINDFCSVILAAIDAPP